MSFAVNNNQQLSLTDSTFNLTEREKRFLEKSWAKVFAEKIFPGIHEEDFSVLYSNKASRPNTPVNVIVGAMILKEVLGVTDDEMVQGLMFDIRYQYALHTTSFTEQPLSDRPLCRFRARCLAYETETGTDLIHACITRLAKEISEFMGITPNMQRMDSLMVAANIRNLSLLELFYTCVANLAKVMAQHEIKIPDAQKHYLEKDDDNRFIYQNREQDAAQRTILVMHEAEKLLELCVGEFDDTSEYQLLIRLLKEQPIFDDDGTRRLRDKKKKEEPSKVLKKPDYLEVQPVYDETATLVTDGAYSGEHNDRCNANFALENCRDCPYREQCNPSFRKSYALREVSWNAVNRAKQLRHMKTEEFREYTHFRNGVEAVPSLLRRKNHVDKIPVHGKKQTRLHFGFKIAALNFQKLLDYTDGLYK